MKKLLLLICFVAFLQTAFCQQSYWQQKTDYKIAVTLNDADNSITGFETIDYYNNSPDTLQFIWLHLWPNAYKNDRTTFSDQLLENGRTDFYFSPENKKGYINRLSFKVGNFNAVTEDHPQHQDIVKLLLPQPLAPGKMVKIETPFHVKLPYNFSRGGHVEQSYQLTQWYPKPAVYDKDGWHEMPYLDQGEFYSEFGNFDVEITVPDNYVVAATGNLQNEEERLWLKTRSSNTNKTAAKTLQKKNVIASSASTKTLRFTQNNVHDFAWFADKTFAVKLDTLQLAGGKVVNTFAFFLPANETLWANSLTYIKKAITSKSNWLGEYPYDVVSVVDDASPTGGGMEYPTITLLNAGGSEKGLESVINHEIGHNWFYGILATNERMYPWMDEGMNSYYDKKYDTEIATKTNDVKNKSGFPNNKIPEYPEENLLQTIIYLKKDQPINTTSENFSVINYGLIAYTKSALWLKKLENELGAETFNKVMQVYFAKWKFKHPTPDDFKKVAEDVSGKSLTALFAQLDTKGPIESPIKKQVKLTAFFNLKETDKYHYIAVSPAIGANYYDKLMIGALVHNYNLPPSNLQFALAPLYATGTKKLNGTGRVEYNFFPTAKGDKLIVSVSGTKFTGGSFTDSTGTKNPLQFSKIVPSLKYVFANKNARSNIKKFVQFKTFIINETGILFTRDFVNDLDIITYPKEQRYVNQLQFSFENDRALYPYNAVVQGEQGDGFVRLNFTGNYFFNYANKGGLNVRLFAGKFIYIGDKSFTNQFKTDAYHLNMSGPKGFEDYNYSNYFVGRNEFEGFSSQQIMNRDGFFKVRTDLLSSKIGKTDDWLGAVNFTTSIPKGVNPLELLPIKIPLKLFLDLGTYAEAWKRNNSTGRLLYDAGLQLSLFKNVLNVYFPILYSKVYSDYFKSTITEKRFVKNISFNIDMQQLNLSKLLSLPSL
ncbi:MAG: M1 family metallopeptidase [Ferruginibacter sp.]